MKEELVQMQGTVVHRLKNALIVALASDTATLAGRMQQHRVCIVCSDRVSVELTPTT